MYSDCEGHTFEAVGTALPRDLQLQCHWLSAPGFDRWKAQVVTSFSFNVSSAACSGNSDMPFTRVIAKRVVELDTEHDIVSLWM